MSKDTVSKDLWVIAILPKVFAKYWGLAPTTIEFAAYIVPKKIRVLPESCRWSSLSPIAWKRRSSSGTPCPRSEETLLEGQQSRSWVETVVLDTGWIP